MVEKAKRWLGVRAWELTGRAARNRRELYAGSTGLRILTFHETRAREMKQLERVVSWCERNFELAGPADADAIVAGSWVPGARDRVLLTFDDGFESNFEAAAWLAQRGISAIFFVVPSLVGRSIDEFMAYHRSRWLKLCAPIR